MAQSSDSLASRVIHAKDAGTAMAGRVAVVTGSARGIGWATVEALAAEGAIPVLIDMEADALARAGHALAQRGVPCRTIVADVASEAEVDAAFEQVVSQYGRIDILVNNAATVRRFPTLEVSLADWQKVLDVNLTGVFLCARAAARTMVPARRGSIVNVASIMGLSGGAIYANLSYHSTKGAVVNLTRALAVEWGPVGVRVNAVAPTWVRTEFTKNLMSQPEMIERMKALMPLRRLAEPSEVADAIAFLASDRASMITGHTLPVDGGFLAQ